MKHLPRPSSATELCKLRVYENKTRDEVGEVLAKMELVVPWSGLQALIDPAYPTCGRTSTDRSAEDVADGLSAAWFGLADEAVEDAIYDSQSMRD